MIKIKGSKLTHIAKSVSDESIKKVYHLVGLFLLKESPKGNYKIYVDGTLVTEGDSSKVVKYLEDNNKIHPTRETSLNNLIEGKGTVESDERNMILLEGSTLILKTKKPDKSIIENHYLVLEYILINKLEGGGYNVFIPGRDDFKGSKEEVINYLLECKRIEYLRTLV